MLSIWSHNPCSARVDGALKAGQRQHLMHRYDEAQRFFDEAWVATTDLWWQAYCEVWTGMNLQALEIPEAALMYYDWALRVFAAEGPAPNIAVCELDRAECLYSLKRFEEAVAAADRARTLFAALRDRHGRSAVTFEAQSAYRAISALLSLERYVEVEWRCADARRLFEDSGDSLGVARCYRRYAQAVFARGCSEESVAAFELARREFGRLGRAEEVAWCLDGKGEAQEQLGHLDAALATFERAATVRLERRDVTGASDSLLTAAVLLERDGRADEAEAALARAEALLAVADAIPPCEGDEVKALLEDLHLDLRYATQSTAHEVACRLLEVREGSGEGFLEVGIVGAAGTEQTFLVRPLQEQEPRVHQDGGEAVTCLTPEGQIVMVSLPSFESRETRPAVIEFFEAAPPAASS